MFASRRSFLSGATVVGAETTSTDLRRRSRTTILTLAQAEVGGCPSWSADSDLHSDEFQSALSVSSSTR
jgi:hypothetical protein